MKKLYLYLSALLAFAPVCLGLSGVVIDQSGSPVAGAQVTVAKLETYQVSLQRIVSGKPRSILATAKTDAFGTFTVPAPDGVVAVDVVADGYVASQDVEPGSASGVTISLTNATIIDGVVKSKGKPVAGAVIVTASDLGIRELAKSDEKGHFRLADPMSMESILVIHPAFALQPEVDLHKPIELDPGIAVKGSVLDEHGKAAAHATVIADEVAYVTADENGRFAFEHVRRSAHIRARSETGGGTATVSNGDVVVRLKAMTQVKAVVLDDEKKPIAGALLIASDAAGFDLAIAGDKGAFAIWSSSAKPEVHAYAGSTFVEESAIDIAKTHELIMKRLHVVEGTVRDEEGKPVAGVHVGFEQQSDQQDFMMQSVAMRTAARAVSGIDGHFRFHLSTGTHGRLTAMKPASPKTSSDLVTVAAAGLHDITLKLTRGIDIAGVVRDSRGQPVAGVAIRRGEQVSPRGMQLQEGDAWARTADDGTFHVAMEPGSTALVFAKSGYVSATEAVDVVPGVQPLAITLSSSVIVRGRVLHTDGTPVATEPIADQEMQTYAITKDDGSFELSFREAGSYTLRVGQHGRRKHVDAPADNVKLILDDGLTLRGRVVDAASHAPIDEFSVMVEHQDGQADSGENDTEAPGMFHVEGLEAGAVSVMVSAPHYLPARVDAQAGQTDAVVVSMKKGVPLHGRVHDAAGKPLEGVKVERGGGFEMSMENIEINTKADGTFELEGVSPEGTELAFSKKGYVNRRQKAVPPKGDELVDVELAPGVSVKGHVFDADGKPAVETEVSATSAVYGAEYASATTDASGAFEIEGLRAAHYDFTAGERGSALYASAPDVDIVRTHDITLRMQRKASGTLVGRVAGVNATQLMRTLEIDFNDGSMRGVINTDGSFRVPNVPVGMAKVKAEVATTNGMRQTRPAVVDVVADAETSVDLKFEEQRVVRGRVTHGGPAAYALLSFSGANWGSGQATTKEDGTYEVRLDPDRYSVTLTSAQGVAFPYHGEVDAASTSTFDIDIDTNLINVSAVDGETGEPMDGATVETFRAGTHSEMKVETRLGGMAAIEVPRGETRNVIVSKKGYANFSVEARDHDVVARMIHSAGAVVHVIDLRDGSTLSGYVVARDATGRVIASTSENEGDGKALLAIVPGEYRFSASAQGYGSETVHATVPGGDIRIALPRGGKLILRSNTELHGNARLLLPDGDVYVRCWCSGIADIELEGVTTTVEAVSPGSYTLEFTPKGGQPRRYPVTVVEGQTTPVQID